MAASTTHNNTLITRLFGVFDGLKIGVNMQAGEKLLPIQTVSHPIIIILKNVMITYVSWFCSEVVFHGS